MADDHPNGYLKFSRRPIGKRNPVERIRDYSEVWMPHWDEGHLREQG